MTFVDVQDGSMGTNAATFLSASTRSILDSVAVWMMILALGYQTLATLLQWNRISGIVETRSTCWWQVLVGCKNWNDERASCRRNRHFQCQRRRNRRRKGNLEDGSLMAALNNQFCELPPPLPLYRHRRAKNNESESATNSTIANQESESQASSKPHPKSSKKQRPTQTMRTVPRTSGLDLARMQQWSRLVDRITSHRREARLIDSDGLMPLHWACSGGAPLEVIEAVLKAYPRASKRSDYNDSTALHFACHYGASAQVVGTLLKAYPKAVYKKDRYGRTPLYHAIIKSSSLEVIRVLVDADPSMVVEPCLPPKANRQDDIPAYERWPQHRTPLFLAWNAVISFWPYTRRRRRNGKVWEKALLLLEVAYRQATTSKRKTKGQKIKFQMLHAVIKLDAYLPPRVLHLALERYPQQLRQADGVDGRRPLAIAAESDSPRAPDIIKLLVKANSQAARVPDANGQTPLAIALESGKQWDDGVKTILEAAPDVLIQRDAKTNLYPALVAAASSDITDKSSEKTCAAAPGESFKKETNDSESTRHPYDDISSETTNTTEDTASNWRFRAPPSIDTGNQVNVPDLDPDSAQISTIYEMIRANPSLVKW